MLIVTDSIIIFLRVVSLSVKAVSHYRSGSTRVGAGRTQATFRKTVLGLGNAADTGAIVAGVPRHNCPVEPVVTGVFTELMRIGNCINTMNRGLT